MVSIWMIKHVRLIHPQYWSVLQTFIQIISKYRTEAHKAHYQHTISHVKSIKACAQCWSDFPIFLSSFLLLYLPYHFTLLMLTCNLLTENITESEACLSTTKHANIDWVIRLTLNDHDNFSYLTDRYMKDM